MLGTDLQNKSAGMIAITTKIQADSGLKTSLSIPSYVRRYRHLKSPDKSDTLATVPMSVGYGIINHWPVGTVGAVGAVGSDYRTTGDGYASDIG